jgi:transcription initiation factor TFIIB
MLVQKGQCPECGGGQFVTDMETGEIACSRCGLVLQDEILDQKPEWRAFTPEETRSKARTGPPTSLRQFDKARVHSSAERNLSQAMNELTRLSDKLHIPASVEENAALIYRKALDEGLIRGRSIKSIAAAALYAACRLTRTPRSLKEIAEASTRRRKEISRCYRLLQRELDIKMPVDDPSKYISKIASQVGLTQKTQNTAFKLLKGAKEKKGIVGKGPTGMAAAALYIAAIINEQSLTQRELAKAADVTEVTVRNRYKELDRILGLKLRSKKKNQSSRTLLL